MTMHKPPRKWPGFVKEVGIVVLGVGLALAAQQAAEWWNWRGQVAQAREALASETAQNLGGAIRRMRTVQCGEARLNELGRILDDAARTGQLPPVGYIGQPPRFMPRSGVWDSVVSSQASHFSRKELSNFGSLYIYVGRMSVYTNFEAEAWSSLYAMVGPGRRLDPASEAELRKALSSARNVNRTMGNLAFFLVRGAAALNLPFDHDDLAVIADAEKQSLTGVKPSLNDGSPMSMICDPIGSVPPNYGEAQAQDSAALVGEAAKKLPDFGVGAK